MTDGTTATETAATQTATASAATEPAAAETATTETAERLPRPRIRTGAAVWGALVATAGSLLLWMLLAPARRTAVVDRLLELSPFEIAGMLAVALGAGVALIALVAVVRRAQVRRGGSR